MGFTSCRRCILQSKGFPQQRMPCSHYSSHRWSLAWTLLLLCLCLHGWPHPAAAACSAVSYTKCPSAMAAANALTDNNPLLTISNPEFRGFCNPSLSEVGLILMTNMGCHELASLMPLGALVLSTGDAQKASLLSNSPTRASLPQSGGAPGDDTDLQAASTLAGYSQTLHDQVLLQFDITPTQSGNLAFQYVFGSEEYPDFTPAVDPDTAQNDIFGFFIWTGSGPATNVGLLPNSTTPVSIATVNTIVNNEFYVPNSGGASPKATEFNGYTTLIKTKDYYVTAGTTYHVKLGIADGGDPMFDSVVWVKAGSVRFNIKDCVGSYVPNGKCTGHCEGGPGILPEIYVITVPAQNGGNPCAITNGTIKTNTTCVNYDWCPVNCTASWVPVAGSCTGACGGGDGFTQETWVVTSDAQHGGFCAHINGTMRATSTSCTNNAVCPPVNCVGSWVADGVCSGACGGGPGLLPERYTITVSAANGGTSCPNSDGDTRNITTCTNSNNCPINCVGSWVAQSGTCNGTCGGGAGYARERYTVTTTAQYGGAACPEIHGALRRILPCNNSTPCPVNCTYYWDQYNSCTGACNNGSGQLPERLVITSIALHGGYCPGSNGTTRLVTPCINPTPCPPVDCVGDWSSIRSCNGTCGGGNGTGLQDFIVTTPPLYGGANCSFVHGAVRQVPCINGDCCPRNCVGVWNISGPCDGHCHNGTGFVPETYSRIITMDCWGTQCPHDHGEVRRVISCINSTPCPPQNCTGSWVSNGPCNGTCGGGAGIQPERYAITTPANYSGTECPESDGATRAIMPCNNTTPCPIDCVGHWSILTGNCTGHCQGGQGFVPEVFNVTVAAAHGGKACNFSHGTYRYVINCTNNIPCPPRNCQGQWVDDGDCIGGCGPRSNALRGLMPERFIITITAAYGGQNCTNAAGDTQLTKSCLNELFPPCVNIPCNATWVTNGVCNGTCGGGPGMLPQRYHIYTPHRDRGTPCVAANNTLRQNQSCTNPLPCPINCSYIWQANGPCTGMCNNGSGLLPEEFVVTAEPQHNGSCPFTNGTTRLETACINSTPCPVNCVGTWIPAGNCTSCDGAAGLLPETFVIQTPAQHGGTNCSHAHGDTRLSTSCTGTRPCPVHCQGHWETDGDCNGPCNNGTGTLPERYNITQPALHEGHDCEAAHGDTRSTVACKNPKPCPINCAGTFVLVEDGPCSGACGGGIGTKPEMFVINVPAQYGGIGCFIVNGTLRHTATCVNSAPCIPVNCVGGFTAFGPCSALCGGNTGFVPEKYTVSVPAVYGGKACEFVSGATRYTTACTNNTVCPYGDVKVVISPPVLPPLHMSAFNDTDIVIKGGNVTITGMRVEGISGSGSSSSTSGSSSFTPDSIGGSNSSTDIDAATGKPLKPRLAAFNGSLGFQTLGVLIEVLGEFELQRTMNWTWNEKWPAWITEVIIKGRFLLTREEIVNDVTVGVETMEPRVAGYLTLYSAIYPGPGFSGTYDWAGELEMSPDPFQKWADAADFLLQNGTNRTSPVPSQKRFRALLESDSSTGTVPVQGRVSVREAKEAVSGVGTGAAYLDDTGDVMVVGPGPGPESNPNYIPVTKPGNIYPEDESALGGTNPKLVTIILAAVLAPAGVAMCASGVIAGILWKRRTRKEEQMDKADKTGRLARLHKHPDGGVAGRQQQKGSPGNEASPDGTLSEAQLEISSPGSRRDSPEADEAHDDPAGASRTRIQRLAPGETGFGSMPGGFDAMVTLPPRRDSVDWTMLQVEASRGSATARDAGMAWRISINGMRNSFTGIANGFAAALRIRMSQSGGAYAVPNTAAAQAENEVQVSGGSTLLWTNPVFTGSNFRADAALGRRVPTLPGESSTAASPLSRGTSLDMAEFVSGASTSPKSPKSGPQHTHLRPPSASGAAKRAAAKPAGKKGL